MDTRQLSRYARQRFGIESLRFPDLATARQVAIPLNVSAGDLYALGWLDEALRILLDHYAPPQLFSHAASYLEQTLGVTPIYITQRTFIAEFPTHDVYLGRLSPDDYLILPLDPPTPAGWSGIHASLRELILVHVHNLNPAAEPLKPLFDDAPLQNTSYPVVVNGLDEYFRQALQAQESGESPLDILRAPAMASPHSLEGQIQFLIQRWGELLGADLVQRLLRAIDFVREETVRRHGPAEFKPSFDVPTYEGYPEYERYSPDQEWMPRLVLIAKNIYVWLDQLSRKYQRQITRLDQIPDEELDLLARRGFTGLWLIGLWERSRASRKIKQRMGQADAVASAYSLYSYDIAADLGGWETLANLRWRAWQRGIRLAADMVPNHMGIDSIWLIEHPDWFLSVDQPPYLSYTFNSENLSDDPRVAIVLEDHYHDRSDAAVVFKLHHYETNRTRYVYHGNDGTSFPWNDTAQLNYLNPEVREAVIQTILNVARNFPIIRFDAAMTLVKRHIQRLWFPEPGAGGAIPSRAEHGMTRAEFDAAMPEEFWRQVVDRVAAEVPDTLLLAEAFWLMEGYFVRTLGMHRVYNSAFMHMLRDEENAKYRLAIKNTLEFDPRILQRYVNFMNNPDEKTAAEQFGKGDKYFGVCVLLCTLPGLPMFGHGQIEGFYEKYGMEYRRARWEEIPDEGFIHYHEQIIFPLLHRRRLFAGVENFFLYDLFTPEGTVDENVFAYSNRLGDDRALVIYHNRFANTQGWIRLSAARLQDGRLQRVSLAKGLGLPAQGFVIVRDSIAHREHIRSCQELAEKGLYVELGAYQCHVFLDFRFVDGEGWKRVHDALAGAGAPSVQAVFDELVGRLSQPSEAEPAPEVPTKPKRTKRTPSAKATPQASHKSVDKGSRRKKPKGN